MEINPTFQHEIVDLDNFALQIQNKIIAGLFIGHIKYMINFITTFNEIIATLSEKNIIMFEEKIFAIMTVLNSNLIHLSYGNFEHLFVNYGKNRLPNDIIISNMQSCRLNDYVAKSYIILSVL